MARRKKTNEDESADNSENINESDDNFGLPEIEYEPLDRSEVREETPVEESSYNQEVVNTEAEYEAEEIVEESHHHDDHIFNASEEKSSAAPKVIAILVVLVLIAVGAWFFMVYKPRKEAEDKVRRDQIALDEAARKKADAERAAALKREEDERRIADSLANAKPIIGTIETLSERTGRYYVVVASDIDEDLIMDFAKQLSAKGISSTIIPPHGKVTFSRIAVASGETYTDAQATADGLKGEYAGGAWVTKY